MCLEFRPKLICRSNIEPIVLEKYSDQNFSFQWLATLSEKIWLCLNYCAIPFYRLQLKFVYG